MRNYKKIIIISVIFILIVMIFSIVVVCVKSKDSQVKISTNTEINNTNINESIETNKELIIEENKISFVQESAIINESNNLLERDEEKVDYKSNSTTSKTNQKENRQEKENKEETDDKNNDQKIEKEQPEQNKKEENITKRQDSETKNNENTKDENNTQPRPENPELSLKHFTKYNATKTNHAVSYLNNKIKNLSSYEKWGGKAIAVTSKPCNDWFSYSSDEKLDGLSVIGSTIKVYIEDEYSYNWQGTQTYLYDTKAYIYTE